MTTTSAAHATPSDTAGLFDASYYATGCGAPYERSPVWLALHGAFADHIVSDIASGSVLDAGCAIGLLVEALRNRGVDAWGIDISAYAIGQVPVPLKPYCAVHSVTEPLGRRFDLVVCIEVLEHLPRAQSELALANLCRHADDILFSSSPEDYKEATHFNVQPPEYWAEHFAKQGFYRDVDFDAGFITPWAARFRKRHEPSHRLAKDYERKFWLLQNENAQLRQQAGLIRANLEQAEQARVERDQARAEAQHLRALVQRYEQGRLMRLMRWLKGLG